MRRIKKSATRTTSNQTQQPILLIVVLCVKVKFENQKDKVVGLPQLRFLSFHRLRHELCLI